MNTLQTQHNEDARLKELDAYNLFDIEDFEDYNFLTALAADICKTKVALISIIGKEKQWILSSCGLSINEMPRKLTYCDYAIQNPEEPLIVTDARQDKRFFDNPHTLEFPNIIFYAGIPLVTMSGNPLGVLCVFDNQPKKLTEEQLQKLQGLAKQIFNLFENRKNLFQLHSLNQELEKKNQLLLETQELHKIGVWDLEIESDKVNWSDIVYDIHELPRGTEIEKEKAINFYHPNYRNIISESIKKCIEKGESCNLECLIVTAKNNEKWIRATGRKVGNTLLGSFQDITELKQNGIKYKGIFNSTFSFLGFLDTEGRMLEVNDTALVAANIKREKVIGSYFWDTYWWQHSEKIQQELKMNFKKVLKGETIEYETQIWGADKKIITILFSLKPIFDEKGQVVFVIPEGRPIQEIVETRRKYKSVIEGTNVGTWELDMQNENTVYDEQWARMLGYTLSELQPTTLNTWRSLVHPEDQKKAYQIFDNFSKQNKEFYELETRMRHKDGHWIWVLDRGKVFEWTDDGKPLKMYGTHQDITARKIAEKNRETLLNRFEKIAENLPGMIYQFQSNPDGTMYFPYSSSGIQRIFEVSPEDVKNDATFLSKKIHPDDLETFTKSIEKSNKNKSKWHVIFRVIQNNGDIIWVEGNSTPQNQEDGSTIWHGFIQDITNRKNAENELLYHKNRLDALFNLSPLGIMLNDFDTGQFIDANERILEYIGYSKSEIREKSLWNFVPTDKTQELQNILINLSEDGRYDYIETEYVNKKGEKHPIGTQGVVINDTNGRKLIWSFVRDIIDEINAEKKLKEAISKLQGILDASQQVAIVATDLSGKIEMFNSGAEKLFGYKTEEIVGIQTPDIFNLPQVTHVTKDSVSIEYKRNIKGFEHFKFDPSYPLPLTTEFKLVRKDGSVIPTLISINAIKNEDEVIGILGVVTDISELKSREKEIKSLLGITNEQNERLRNFAHIVSHNLRSHTGAISGILDIIKIENPEMAKNEMFSYVYQSAQNLQKTMNDLSEVIKVNLADDQITDVFFQPILNKNLDSLQPKIKESNLTIINEIESDLKVKGIVAYIDSIILNMITNAIKYRDKNKKSYLKIYSVIRSNMIDIYFEDNGIGMNLEDYGDKLFGLYNTFHDVEDSRGVGLFITKNQILTMGGKINVASELNIGSTFIVSLPK